MSILYKLNMYFKYGYKRNNSSFIKHLKEKGIKIGDNVCFFSPEEAKVDTQYPFLISIGDNVGLSAGIRILTHDYSWSVIKREYGDILGSSGKVEIGSNVFIGAEATLLKGAKIGDNVIIGAGSLVTGEIPANSVAVGRPAKVVMSLDDFYKKRKENQEKEAEDLFYAYYNRYHKIPNINIFREYIFLFKNDYDKLSDNLKDVFKRGGDKFLDKSITSFKNYSFKYESFDAFIKHCKNKFGVTENE